MLLSVALTGSAVVGLPAMAPAPAWADESPAAQEVATSQPPAAADAAPEAEPPGAPHGVPAAEPPEAAAPEAKDRAGAEDAGDAGNRAASPEQKPPAAPVDGIEDLTGRGSWVAADQKWQWRGKDGNLARSRWARIDGSVYRFDDDGNMLTGWWKDGQSWYHLADSGARSTGWTQDAGTWYYLDPTTGIMTTGWIQVDGSWYHLQGSGAMSTGWTQVDGSWFYLSPSSGAMATGWLQDGSTWYYLDPGTGAMVTGTRTINGNSQTFASSGAWIGYQAPSGYLQPVASITPLGWSTNTLTWGMNGVKVRIVQGRLGLWHSTKLASVDASFVSAVRNFQRRVGLPQTGTVDEATWNALDTGFSWWVDQYQEAPTSLSATRGERIETMIGYAWNQIGSSYTWGGAGPYGLGFDCSGLVLQSLYRAGLDPQPIDVIKHGWPDYRTSQELYHHPQMMHVPLSQRQRGDLIFYTSDGVVTHVAIYLGDDQVVHTDWMGRPARMDHITVSYGWANMTSDVVRPFP